MILMFRQASGDLSGYTSQLPQYAEPHDARLILHRLFLLVALNRRTPRYEFYSMIGTENAGQADAAPRFNSEHWWKRSSPEN